MSYILDSLKKLEKEQSGLETKLNLKELIFQRDSEVNTEKVLHLLKKRNYLLTFLAFVSALFLFLNYYHSNIVLSPPPNSSALKEKKTPTQAKTRVRPDSKLFSPNNPTVFDSTNGPHKKAELGPEKIEVEIDRVNKSEGISVSYDFSDDELDRRLKYLEETIQQEYVSETLKKQTVEDVNYEKPIFSLQGKSRDLEVLPESFLDLKVKGIIFFGQDNLMNYVLLDYEGQNHIKMKVGDSFNEIKLLEIREDKILLIYKGKTIEKGMRS